MSSDKIQSQLDIFKKELLDKFKFELISGHVAIDGSPKTKGQFETWYLETLNRLSGPLELNVLVGAYEFKPTLREKHSKNLYKEITEVLKLEQLNEIKGPQYKPAILEHSGEVVFLDDECRVVMASEKAIRKQMTSNRFDKFVENAPILETEFNAYDLSPYWETTNEQGDVVKVVNSAMWPEWRYKEIPKTTERPSVVRDLLYGCIDSEEQIQFFESKLHLQLFVGRVQDVQIFNGQRGNGTSSLQALLKKMVGQRMYQKAPRGAWTTTNNSFLLDKLIVVSNEQDLNFEASENIKDYLDPTITPSEKYLVAKRELYVHFMLLAFNNKKKHVKILPDERRYSVYDLRKKMLHQTYGRVQGKYIYDELNKNLNKNNIAEDYAAYLYNLKPICNEGDILPRTEHFYSLLECTMAAWQKRVIRYLKKEGFDRYDYEEFRKGVRSLAKNSKTPDDVDTYIDFFNLYAEEEDDEPLATVEEDEDGTIWIIPHKKYIKSESNGDLGL